MEREDRAHFSIQRLDLLIHGLKYLSGGSHRSRSSLHKLRFDKREGEMSGLLLEKRGCLTPAVTNPRASDRNEHRVCNDVLNSSIHLALFWILVHCIDESSTYRT